MISHFTTCPYCGAEIEIESDIIAFKCPNCDAAVVLDLNNEISETQIFETPSSRTAQDNNKSSKPSPKRFFTIILVAFIIFGTMLVGLGTRNLNNQPIDVPMPYNISDFMAMDYNKAKEKFESAGFNNVKCVREDKKFNAITGALNGMTKHIKTGDIKDIVIDQTIKKFKKGDLFLSDSEIIITYYNIID